MHHINRRRQLSGWARTDRPSVGMISLSAVRTLQGPDLLAHGTRFECTFQWWASATQRFVVNNCILVFGRPRSTAEAFHGDDSQVLPLRPPVQGNFKNIPPWWHNGICPHLPFWSPSDAHRQRSIVSIVISLSMFLSEFVFFGIFWRFPYVHINVVS